MNPRSVPHRKFLLKKPLAEPGSKGGPTPEHGQGKNGERRGWWITVRKRKAGQRGRNPQVINGSARHTHTRIQYRLIGLPGLNAATKFPAVSFPRVCYWVFRTRAPMSFINQGVPRRRTAMIMRVITARVLLSAGRERGRSRGDEPSIVYRLNADRR